jgi:hypothetical protein
MPRKLSPEHQFELESLYQVLQVFGDFADRLMPDVAPAMSDGLRRAYEARDVRGLRMARGDMVAMAQAATVVQRRELDAQLRARAGVSLDELTARDVQRVDRIRSRGRVSSEEQYYLVRERAEFLGADPARSAECAELQRLLDAYESRAVPPLPEHK